MPDGGPDLHVRWLGPVIEPTCRLVGAVEQLQTEIQLGRGANAPDAGNADLRTCAGARPRLRYLHVQSRHLKGAGELAGPIAGLAKAAFLEAEAGIGARS